MKPNIIIVESRDILRIGLKTIFLEDERTGIIYEATSLDEMNTHLQNASIDLVVINQALVDEIHLLPHGRFVILMKHFDIAVLEAAYKNGARGYIFENAPADLLWATLSLKQGEFLIDPAVTAQLLERISYTLDHSVKEELLTPRERDILSLLQKGIDRRSIAQRLGISETTLKTHIKNITKKSDGIKLH
jgi:DNA-binding NarL/FixJ family response regulator